MNKIEKIALEKVVNNIVMSKENHRAYTHAYICPVCGTLHIVSDDGCYECVLCGHLFAATWDSTEYQYMTDGFNTRWDLTCCQITSGKNVQKSFGIRIPLLDGTFAISESDVLTKPVDAEKLFNSIPNELGVLMYDKNLLLPNFTGKKRFYEMIQEYKTRKATGFFNRIRKLFAA